MKRLILGLVLFQLASPALAGVDVLSIRIWHSPLRTRLVFDLSGPVVYSVFALADPQRIVIDLKDTVSSAVPPGDQDLGSLASSPALREPDQWRTALCTRSYSTTRP